MTGSWKVKGVLAGVAMMGLVAVGLFVAAPASAGGVGLAGPATALHLVALGADDAEYIGSGKCKMCHIKSYKSWAETGHAQALESLKPGEDVEAKKKAELDPEKDYTTDEGCLSCHVVGAGKKGGYSPTADAAAAKKMVKHLGHVGCESCHGPGGGYYDLHKDLKKSKREYTWSEMEAAGMIKMDAEGCQECHNEKSPTRDPNAPFDFEKMKEKGIHALVGLKQRKD